MRRVWDRSNAASRRLRQYADLSTLSSGDGAAVHRDLGGGVSVERESAETLTSPAGVASRMTEITCPRCGDTSESGRIALVERLVAYHPITVVTKDRVLFQSGRAQHVSWYTRPMERESFRGHIVFVATCLRCEHEFNLPPEIRRAEAE